MLLAYKRINNAVWINCLKNISFKKNSLLCFPLFFSYFEERCFYTTRISGRQAAPYSSCEVPGDVPRHMFRGMYKDKFRGMCLDMFRGMYKGFTKGGFTAEKLLGKWIQDLSTFGMRSQKHKAVH